VLIHLRTACTVPQTKIIGELRPFESVDDLRVKLRKTKGVSQGLFDTYVDVIQVRQEHSTLVSGSPDIAAQAYSAVDKVFEECRRVGDELSRIMKIWSAAANKVAKPATDAPAPAAAPATDAGLNFVQLNDQLIKSSTEAANASPHLKDAFQGYLTDQPKGVPDTITLKGYQMLGVNWLYLLFRKKHSCILADEMGAHGRRSASNRLCPLTWCTGLGKTCQVIAFLSHIKSIGEKGPHLVIVPSSTLENWMREFATFAPDLSVVSYYGTQREREELRYDIREELEKYDVIVTTYNIAAGGNDDRKFLRKCKFKVCSLDSDSCDRAQIDARTDLHVRRGPSAQEQRVEKAQGPYGA
jgi:SWI/SNF-related matrix-associated actin-dependent regulator 1 of chromatin subfamily A